MLSAVDLVALVLFGAILLFGEFRTKWGWLRLRKSKTLSPPSSPAPTPHSHKPGMYAIANPPLPSAVCRSVAPREAATPKY